ncbi:MAG: hypothetical protein IJW92_05670 [Clostridia bacterium]|nr:hypothetical protein [Clostridia bacterium]
MNLFKRIFSTLLAVIMMVTAMSSLASLEVSAAETSTAVEEFEIDDYITHVYNNPDEKLASMGDPMLVRDGYALYVDKKSGEVALRDTTSGNILFSNPYDVASSAGAEATKGEILSQIIIQYLDNGQLKSINSYKDAALNDQISVQKIKNGIRVEYTIGNENGRKLVPKRLLSTSFETYIKAPILAAYEDGEIDEYSYEKLVGKNGIFWTDRCVNDMASSYQKAILITEYPICGEIYGYDDKGEALYNRLYVFNEDLVSQSDLLWCETMIKLYCTDYSFEQMDADHEECGYVAEDEQYPVFKLALEYTVDENGLSVRLPCNGLRYDMSAYTLENISVLPYMGAGNSNNAGYEYTYEDENGKKVTATTIGYNFFPDGSGSLFDHEMLAGSTTDINAPVYGLDYALNTIADIKYQKNVRYPVYGVVSSEVFYEYIYTTKDDPSTYVTAQVSNTVMTPDEIEAKLKTDGSTLISTSVDETIRVYQRGFVAIMEEGESLAKIRTYHAGTASDYQTVMNQYNPKPKDSYDLSDAISVASSGAMTVVSDRKYTGSITLRYIMLCDEQIAEETKETAENYTPYATSWLGMAEAYRDYLCATGTLTQLTDADVEEDIPLYLEVFGAMETLTTIATIPVSVMTPLTTFDNISAMYTQLADLGVKNINFKMTGFANGGMYYTVPYNLNWEDAVGGKSGFIDLVNEANALNAEKNGKHMGLYPDFDFAYIQNSAFFDGLSLRDDAVKTIDNRYTSYRSYSATEQAYVSFYQLAISPSRYSKFYTKLLSNYTQYGLPSMSVASLGNSLNSDFDEEDPYNREDSKGFTKETLAALKNADGNNGYSLMTDGGNAYTWAYVDHILNVDLDSSRYLKSSASVPFIGAVLHGYVQFAGAALNEEGNIDYAMLRALENGSSIYFILSYQNTEELKQDYYLNQNYSVRYDIWIEDVAAYYDELNQLLKDVQTKVMIDHQFLVGERVLDLDELEEDILAKLEGAINAESQIQKDLETEDLITVADAWAVAYNAESTMTSILQEMKNLNTKALANRTALINNSNLQSAVEGVLSILTTMETMENGDLLVAAEKQLDLDELLAIEVPTAEERAEIETLTAEIKAINDDYGNQQNLLADAYSLLKNKLNTIKSSTLNLTQISYDMKDLYEQAKALVENVKTAIEIVQTTSVYNDDGNDENGSEEAIRINLLNLMREFLVVAQNYLGEENSTNINTVSYQYYQYNKTTGANGFLNPDSQVYALDSGCGVINRYFTEYFENGAAFAKYQRFQEAVLTECASELFTKESILAQVDTGADDNLNDNNATSDDTYVVDNNQIVLVVYGDRDPETHEKTPTKGFILNYNNFAVRVTYNGITYTIPSGGYIVISDFND